MKKKFAFRSASVRRNLGEGGFISPRALVGLLCVAAACSILTLPLPAVLRSGGPGVSHATISELTFDERVSYQRAIEEVYWRHRIWPKERHDPKPSLDSVMSQAQLEKKVADYLRNSQALEYYWQRSITAEQLQAEMDRMAKHTRQPEVLRELFDALGNDPFAIAECLARPVLAERLATNGFAYDQRIHGELKQHAEADLQAHPFIEQMKQLSGKYSEIEFAKSDSARDEGHPGAERSVKLKSRQWTETVQKLAAALDKPSTVKASKNAIAEAYETIPIGKLGPLQEDEEHYYATAVIEQTKDHLKLATVAWLKEPFTSWRARTENQMRKGIAAPSASYTLPKIPDGATCIDNTWAATTGSPESRSGHTAVWTGTEMIIWGGSREGGDLNTGGKYNPSTDSWTATSLTNAPSSRARHTAVWTGGEMIIWGGFHSANEVNTGGRYNPGTDSWTSTNTTNAPPPRGGHTAVWTGSEMIVWSGYDSGGYLSSGGRYNPTTDTWIATTTINAPVGRYTHTAVWTGSEMIVWGGSISSPPYYTNTGGRYNPATDSWTATSTTNAPTERGDHTAAWTGSEMIIWGGSISALPPTYFNTGGRYNPATDSWIATSITNAPAARDSHTAAWTGSEMFVWGGYFFDGDDHYLNTGGRYNPGTNSWTATGTTNAPSGRSNHTAVWSGSEVIVWGGNDQSPWNTGGRYDPVTDTWTATSPPSGRFYHTAVWTGSEMIIWGGWDNHYLDTGGKYTPGTDSWTPTTAANAPSGRYYHSSVWTGSEMTVWGGLDASNPDEGSNTGGRYDPGTDSWTATATTNAPSGRSRHTAVWTGNEMIVWGGGANSGVGLNTGGRYDPNTDTWVTTNTTNAPAGRIDHTAVWTGSEMIVWGGFGGNGGVDTGGKYDPGTDSWTATTTTSAPTAREEHTAVWTGTEMIVWGGIDNLGDRVNTGGRYNPGTDTWTATSTTNAPSGRFGHTAVWTGSEKIVWGGNGDGSTELNSGGRYNPALDTWAATSTINVPSGREYHTAMWNGVEMIVWGGTGGNTGGRYCAQPGPTPTPTITPTPTVIPTATPRPIPTPRSRPTPHLRPTPR